MYVERSVDRYNEKKETKEKTPKKMRGSVRGLLEEIGTDWKQMYDKEWWKKIVLTFKYLNNP